MDLSSIIVIAVVVGVLLCACLAIANFAFQKFKALYEKYESVTLTTNIGIGNFIDDICKNELKSAIKLFKTDEQFGDAYFNGSLLLTDRTIASSGLASYAIVAHELGHAYQDKNSKMLKNFSFFNRFGKILSIFLLPSLIVGVVLLFFENLRFVGIGLCIFGVVIFIFSLIMKLVVISIEKEASKYAIIFLKKYLTEKELKMAKKFLKSTKLTYWADFFRAMLGWTGLTGRSKLF